MAGRIGYRYRSYAHRIRILFSTDYHKKKAVILLPQLYQNRIRMKILTCRVHC
jgi:hypothetical protein